MTSPVGSPISGGERSDIALEANDRPATDAATGVPLVLVEELFRQHAASVRRLARNIVKNDAMADDVVQEVFLRLHVSPLKYEPERGSAHSYLMACCRGRALDVVRSEASRTRRQDRAAAVRESSNSDVEESVLHGELHRQLADALARLPDHEREPVQLAYLGGLTYAEVAELLDAPTGTVKSQIRRGLAHLGAILIEPASSHEVRTSSVQQAT